MNTLQRYTPLYNYREMDADADGDYVKLADLPDWLRENAPAARSPNCQCQHNCHCWVDDLLGEQGNDG